LNAVSVEVITIRDSVGGSTAAVAPQLGFNCFSFVPQIGDAAVEVLWHDPQFLLGNTRPSRSGIPILFPFAGRIRDARYTYRGKKYELEAADGQGNAIHGFVFTRPWRIVASSEASVTGEFHASLDDPAILERWPADFRIQATYTVAGPRLLASYEISNPGETILPWWFGAHPYFRLSLGAKGKPGGPPEKAIVQFRASRRWLLEGLLPTGVMGDVAEADDLARGVAIGAREFDDVFTTLGLDDDGRWRGRIVDPASRLTTTVSFGEPFRDCVVFIPPHREAICLEPYTSAPNAFELSEKGLGPGLRELFPGQSIVMNFEVEGSRRD
jgi:aldose 1-epimerase